MNEPGGASEFVIGKGTIPIGADLGPLESAKSDAEKIIDSFAEYAKDKLGAAFKAVFDGADERVKSLVAALGEIKSEASASSAGPANPSTGTVPDQSLAILTLINSNVEELKEQVQSVADALATANQ